jgi:NADPH-dependent glutamate synthase beta subunit-like oxidoreductase
VGRLLKKVDKKPVFRGASRHVGPRGSGRRPRQIEKPAPCRTHCPIETDMRGALALVARRERHGLSECDALDAAWRLVVETNPFPAVLGRVCPRPCEEGCNRREKDEAVALGALERFIGDWGLERGLALERIPAVVPSRKSVAIVGAGPAGLSCAYQLVRRGHEVTVYEQHPEPGGMLRYGVPSYRLSRSVLNAEMERLVRAGVVLKLAARVGSDLGFEELQRRHDAVFVAIGAHRGRRLTLDGSGDRGVLSGVEFLRRAHSSPPPTLVDPVVVVGDGETAVDVARVARRLGRDGRSGGNGHASVTLLRAQRPDESDLSMLSEEGIEVEYEVAPVCVDHDEGGALVGVETQKAFLGEPGPDGLRLPAVIGGDRRVFPAATVIAAVSQVPDWGGLGLFEGASRIDVDDWGRTNLEGVWSGGDSIALGIVAESVGQGARAARSIDAHLSGIALGPSIRRQPVSTGRVKLPLYESKPRSSQHRLTPRESLHNPVAEIEQGITRQQVSYEASRCLGCGTCVGCERCWLYCTPGCFERVPHPAPGEPYFSVSLAKCDGCDKCAEGCPSGFIEMI